MGLAAAPHLSRSTSRSRCDRKSSWSCAPPANRRKGSWIIRRRGGLWNVKDTELIYECCEYDSGDSNFAGPLTLGCAHVSAETASTEVALLFTVLKYSFGRWTTFILRFVFFSSGKQRLGGFASILFVKLQSNWNVTYIMVWNIISNIAPIMSASSVNLPLSRGCIFELW